MITHKKSILEYIRSNTPCLAPLAGYSDIAFRLLCRDYGAGIAFTEMVSSKGLLYNSAGTHELLLTNTKDTPLIVQLFGNDASTMAHSVEVLQEQGFTHFDVNVGCSVPKVVKTGSGAGLLKNPEILQKIAEAMVRVAGEESVGIKLRLGWNAENENYIDIAKMLQDAGVAWITLHPRYAKQGYSGIAHWDKITTLVRSVTIPIIASGDIFTAQKAYECLEQTGASSILFARGALTNPAIFEEYTALLHKKEYIKPKAKEIALRHVQYLEQFVPEKRILVRMRSILPRYYKALSIDKSLLHKNLLEAKNCTDIYTIIENLP